MKGIIFNVFEDFIVDNFDIETWNTVLEKANLKSGLVFVAPMTYPDEDFFALVTTAITLKNLNQTNALHSFGQYTFLKLAKRYQSLIEPFKTARELLLNIDPIIHKEVIKLFKESTPPKFTYKISTPDTLTMTYHSNRKLCLFMEGLIKGVAQYYQTDISFHQSKCMLKNDNECTFEIKFKNS